jgi:hypothetical protein
VLVRKKICVIKTRLKGGRWSESKDKTRLTNKPARITWLTLLTTRDKYLRIQLTRETTLTCSWNLTTRISLRRSYRNKAKKLKMLKTSITLDRKWCVKCEGIKQVTIITQRCRVCRWPKQIKSWGTRLKHKSKLLRRKRWECWPKCKQRLPVRTPHFKLLIQNRRRSNGILSQEMLTRKKKMWRMNLKLAIQKVT